MATILAAANGNWSNTATWTGGVVPGAGDIAVANAKTVTLDVATITVASLRTDTTGGATNGGTFALAMPATTINGDVAAGNQTAIMGPAPGRTLTVNGTVTGGSVSYCYGVHQLGGALTVTNATGGAGSSAYGVYQIGGTLTVTNATGGAGAYSPGVYVAGGQATVTDAYGGAGTQAYGCWVNGGEATIDKAWGTAALAGGYVQAGVLTVNEAIGGNTATNTPSVVNANTGGKLQCKKITFGPLGQCPVQGQVRLLVDASIANPFYMALNADYPSAGSGTNPAYTTATALDERVTAIVAEMVRTQ